MGDHRGESEDLLELHARVAEAVCGWTTIQYEEWPGSFVPLLWHESLGAARGRDFGRLADGRWAPWSLPHYSTSLDACAEAELEIGRRDLWPGYILALAEEALGSAWGRLYDFSNVGQHLGAMYVLVTAPPGARVRAMLRAVGSL